MPTNHGLPKLVRGENFNEIIPSGIYSVDPSEPCGPYGWWGEQSLDMAAVHGAAPGANILYVGSRDCNVSLNVALYNVIYNHLADVVTNSWTYNGEATDPGDQSTFDQAALAGAAQGITVLFSSGDGGDLAAANGIASGSFPATSAWVTGVGGTSLLLEDSVSGAKSEYGWGTYRAYLDNAMVNSAKSVTTSGLAQTSAYGYTFDDFAFYSGAGGGISLLEKQPAYQRGAVPHALATSLNLADGNVEILPNKQRVSPDIAMDRRSLYRLSDWRDVHDCREPVCGRGLQADFGDRGVLRDRLRRHEPRLAAHGRRGRGHGPEAQCQRDAVGRIRESAPVQRRQPRRWRELQSGDQSDRGSHATRLGAARLCHDPTRVPRGDGELGALPDRYRALWNPGLRIFHLRGNQRGVELHFARRDQQSADGSRLQRRDGTGRAVCAQAHSRGIKGNNKYAKECVPLGDSASLQPGVPCESTGRLFLVRRSP